MGQKWHVSEILARLEVQTREQAAELWRRERSPRGRLAALLAAFRPAAAVGSIVFGGTLIAGVVIGAAVLLTRPDDAQVPVASPSPTVPSTPESTPASVAASAVPDGPVAFTVCGETIGYRKLTVAEMQSVFTNVRFGDGVKPGPVDWAMYESDYYWITDPHAVSANIENASLSRGTVTAGSTSVSATPPCLAPDQQQSSAFQELWLYDHRVLGMRASDGILVVAVESRPGSFERVRFPEPALTRSLPPDKNNGAPLFYSLQIVDSTAHAGTGHQLASLGAAASTWEYAGGGKLVFGSVASAKSTPRVNIRVPSDLEFICGGMPSEAHTLRFIPESGFMPDSGPAISVAAAVCSNAWQVAAEVHLEAGSWSIESDGVEYSYTVLPKGGARP